MKHRKESNMRFVACVLIAFCGMTTGCMSTVDAGYQGVLVKKPWVFGHGGVDKEPIATGLTWTAPTTEVVRINVQPMQFEMQFNDFMSKDAVPLDFHAVIRLQVTDAVKLVERFGPDWYKNNIGRELENRVRTAVKKHGMNETAIETTAIDQIDAEVSMAMEKYIKDVDLPVKMIAITVGRANPPDSIKTARENTAAEQQRLIMEQQRAKAEEARALAEEKRGIADRSYAEKFGITSDAYVKLKQVEMCATSKGCTLILGSPSGVVVK